MDDLEFGKPVDASRKAAGGDVASQAEELQAILAKLDPERIEGFDRVYRDLVARAYTWDLWGAAYVICGGCSDDGFDYFRDWLISKGRAVYENALRDPETLARVIGDADVDEGCEAEDLRYAAGQAWTERTGRDEDEFRDGEPTASPKSPAGERWEEDMDALALRYPKLAARFA
jgi:hypothetical protein